VGPAGKEMNCDRFSRSVKARIIRDVKLLLPGTPVGKISQKGEKTGKSATGYAQLKRTRNEKKIRGKRGTNH